MTTRFWGKDSGDVHGDVEIFSYELRFAEPPGDEQLALMARAWWEQFGSGAIRGFNWRLSGPFAYLKLHVAGEPDARKCSAQLDRFARRLDAVCPVTEVVFLDADEQFEGLAPGPAVSGGRRPVDPSLPTPAAHRAFDDVIAAQIAEAKQAQFAKLLASPKPTDAGIMLCGAVAPPAQGDYPERFRRIFTDGDGHLQGAVDRPLRRGDLRAGSKITVLREGAPHEIALPGKWSWHRVCAPSPDGARVAVPACSSARRAAVVLLDVASGEIKELWQAGATDGELRVGVAWLDDETLAVQLERRLIVLRIDAGGAEVIATSSGGGHWIYALRAGRLLLGGVKDGQRLFVWDSRKLHAVGKYKLSMFLHAAVDGRVVLRHGLPNQVGPDDLYFELTRLDDVLERFPPKKAVKGAVKGTAKAKGAAKKTSASKPSWVAVETVPPLQLVDEALARRARGQLGHPGDVADSRLRWGPERNPTAVAAPSGHVATIANGGMTLLAPNADEPTQVTGCSPQRIVISEAGTRAYGAHPMGMTCITRGSREPERFAWAHELKMGDVVDAAPVGEDQVVVLCESGLAWLRLSDEGWVKVATTRLKGGSRVIARSGEPPLVAVLVDGPPPLVAYELAADKLRKVASSDSAVEDLRAVNGVLYAVSTAGPGLTLKLPG